MSVFDREIKTIQGSPEWHKSRMGRLTGSIVGEIMPGVRGGSPASRKKLLYKKSIEYLSGVDESTPIPQKYADWGHEHEAEACDALEVHCKEEISKDIEFAEVGLIKSDFNDLVASSLDRISTCGKFAIEVKCPFFMSSHIKHMLEKPVVKLTSDSQSKTYYWQIRHHMLITGATHGIWATYHPHFLPCKLHVEVIERDEEEMEKLKYNCLAFVEDMRAMCKDLI